MPSTMSWKAPFARTFVHMLDNFKVSLALVLVVFLEFALFYLAYTDYTMTNAGLIYDGVDITFARRLALAGVCFMFLIWTVVLNLGHLHTVTGFLKLLPVMVLISIISYFTAGQWILIKLASVEAIRQSSTDLKREVDAYLAPVKGPGELLTSVADQLKAARERFAAYSDSERKGSFTGRPGEGAAVQRLNSVAASIGVAERSVADLKKRWEELSQRSSEQMDDLSQRVEKGGVATAMEVESTLQNLIRDLRAFPFVSLRPGVESALEAAKTAAATSAIPAGVDLNTQENYRRTYRDLSDQVAAAEKTSKGLLDQIEAFKLGVPPILRVKDVRATVYENSNRYLMYIAHSIALVIAPFVYALGPAQIIHSIFLVGWPGLRRRPEELARSSAPTGGLHAVS